MLEYCLSVYSSTPSNPVNRQNPCPWHFADFIANIDESFDTILDACIYAEEKEYYDVCIYAFHDSRIDFIGWLCDIEL